ncbi:MAG: UvrD-helicase domain-containing protein [Mycoplasmataceae bacterium]|nr:UvrD-helicase domain-containing protein [Mycoplasmataceae bacterium]
MIDLSKLNHNQLKAVTTEVGPVLVIAGAGTGKTRVLTTRIAYLIEHENYDHNKILAITFTNKAASEMRNRIINMLGNINVSWIGTYHSICLRILKQDIDQLGRDKNFSIIDEQDQLDIIHDIYKEGEISIKDIKPKKALEIIENVKTENINLFNIKSMKELNELGIYKYDLISSFRYIVKQYENKLIQNNLLDFNDLLIFAHKLLKENSVIREKWQNKFDYILVDEFQDTNYLQFQLLNLLINPNKLNIFAVGDPDQTIYTWRGAYPNIFNDYLDNFKNTKIHVLDLNYRSTKNILRVANHLIDYNNQRIKKDLVTNNDEGDSVICYIGDTSQLEAHFITQQINDLVKTKKYNYNEIVILYRAKYLSRTIEQEFINNNIPYYIFGDIRFYQRREIKDLVSYLKILVKPKDDITLRRIINVPVRGIGQKTIDSIRNYGLQNNLSFYETLLKCANNQIEAEWNKKSVKEFVVLLEYLFTNSKNLSIVDTLRFIIKVTKYEDHLKSLDQFEDRWENVNELIVATEEYQAKFPNNSLVDFLDEISLYTESDDHKVQSRNSVSLMTIHFAKGTEFKVVFIMGMNEDIFPSYRLQSQNDMEEERRIAYVAITRSMKKLFLTCNLGFSPISSDKLTPSRFLKEIGKNNYQEMRSEMKTISEIDLDWYDSVASFNKEDNYRENNVEFKIGDVIVHTVFGSGVIIGIKSDTLEVAFKAPFGIKSIIKTHKSIKRLKN